QWIFFHVRLGNHGGPWLRPGLRTGHSISISTLRNYLAGDNRPRLYALFGATALVLLIAVVNVANLMLARATARSQEFAIRVSLGAARLHLFRQTAVESLLLAALGGAAGLALAWSSSGALRALLPPNVLRGAPLDVLHGRVIVFVTGAVTLCGLMFGAAHGFNIRRA